MLDGVIDFAYSFEHWLIIMTREKDQHHISVFFDSLSWWWYYDNAAQNFSNCFSQKLD
jgi:hypothetical protein